MQRELSFVALGVFVGFLIGAVIGYFLFSNSQIPFSPFSCPACAYSVNTVFSPGAEDEIISFLRSANSSIEAELYQFSHTPLADELIAAKNRGVAVRIILEPRLESNDQLETMNYLRENGVEARWATLKFGRTHSKFAVVDGKKVLVGSTNWSWNAMFKNRESSVIIESTEIANDFSQIFESDWAKANLEN